jgi:hypothetical protein
MGGPVAGDNVGRSLRGHAPRYCPPKVGYHQWKGAEIGAGVGAVLGSVLAFGLAGDCDYCTTSTGDRAPAALLVTGAGSVFGFLVGLGSPKYVWEVAPEASGIEQRSSRRS